MSKYHTTDTESHPWLRAFGRWSLVAMVVFSVVLSAILFAVAGGAF